VRGSYPFAAQTNVGRVRALNEDSLLALPPLYAVADGLGGHQAGEVASALAIDKLRDTAPRDADALGLARAVQVANQAVINAAGEGIGREGMGTTMTAVMVEDGRAVLAQVGDSRAYLLRNRVLTQITEDHSVVGAMVRSGHITVEEARQHPQRSVITRALGSDPNLSVDSFEISVLQGDRLLLCSDGLTGMVDDAHIAEILTGSLDPNQAAEALIEAANEAGGVDNISVIVVDVTSEQSAQARPRHRSKLWLWALLWVLLVVLALGGVVYGAKRYADSQAFLNVNADGRVVVNRGAPGSILGFSLTLQSIPTTVSVDLLSPEDRATLQLTPTYDGVAAARKALQEMVDTSPVIQSIEQAKPVEGDRR
jgi:protein phosphatase